MVPSRLTFTRVVLSSIGVKVNGQYCCDILLSQQMLDAINASLMTIFSVNKTVQRCVQHSPTAAVQLATDADAV